MIPQTANTLFSECAFATKANLAERLVPDAMVTHHWANLFRDTVAAIIADAADDSFYGVPLGLELPLVGPVAVRTFAPLGGRPHL